MTTLLGVVVILECQLFQMLPPSMLSCWLGSIGRLGRTIFLGGWGFSELDVDGGDVGAALIVDLAGVVGVEKLAGSEPSKLSLPRGSVGWRTPSENNVNLNKNQI